MILKWLLHHKQILYTRSESKHKKSNQASQDKIRFTLIHTMKVTLILVRFSLVTKQINSNEKQDPTTINLRIRTVLFWVITQRVLVISYWCFETTYWSNCDPWDGNDRLWPKVAKKITQILHNNLEVCSSHLLHGSYLKSRNLRISLTNRKDIWQLEKKQQRSYLPR